MRTICIFLISFFFIPVFGKNADDVKVGGDEEIGDQMKIVKKLPSTPVKNQYKTSTCWSFCTISLLESELLRMGHGEFDLSEMFVVHENYLRKADRYVRMHGKVNFSAGGEANDVVDVISLKGIVPEDIYSGLKVDTERHIHFEMDKVLEEYVDAIITNPNKQLSEVWEDGFRKVLESYLGDIPSEFDYQGNSYNPMSFKEYLGIDLDDYIMVTSFSHVPFYQSVVLEVPDNWSWKESYNVPLDEFSQIVDSALYNGYSIAWAADNTESGFSFKRGMAVAPSILYAPHSKREEEKWSSKSDDEKNEIIFNMNNPVEELNVTQANRQEAFDNYSTTDDHGMHIVGIARNKSDNKFYYVKNSWGTNNPYEGYLFVSDAYFKYKTISIMLHKDAVPQEIALKLNL